MTFFGADFPRAGTGGTDFSDRGNMTIDKLTDQETLDDLRPGGLKFFQSRKGYRFSLDPVLLCGFVRVKKGERLVDLGTGVGVIPLLLAARTGAAGLVGVEIQPSLADRAVRNVRLNGLENKVQIREGDLRRLSELPPAGGFDVVTANPPFRKLESGRQSPFPERSAARHEQTGGIDAFLRAAAHLLKSGGRLYLIFLAERLGELIQEMKAADIEPKRLRCVHARSGEPARMVLVEGRRNGRSGLKIDPPLFVYDGEEYSPEVMALYGEEGVLGGD